MEKVYEELEEVKFDNEKLRSDLKSKAELYEHLKKFQNEQSTKLHEASSKIEKQAQQLLEKEEEISVVTRANEDLKCNLKEKESIIKHLNAANDKLRAERDGKNQKWEQENGRLVLALDEANEKSIDQEQKMDMLKAEIESLKAQLSVSQKKHSEAEKKAKNQKDPRERDDLLVKVEEDMKKVEHQLKWKKEQFKHLEEAHDRLRNQFKESEKEWEKEKCTLFDEISSLQTRLDSQIRITGDLQSRLQMCNQSLAHEETRRKYLEVEISEFKTRFEKSFAECQDAKSQLECLNSQRDKEVATLRHLLGTKESFYKEMEYRAGKLEQENQELLASLKELQEARIQEAGNSSSLSKLKNKLKSVEQMHKDCSSNLRTKEAEWNSQREEMMKKLNDYSSQLKTKDAALNVLETELESCLSSAVQLKLQNEEISIMMVLLKSGMFEAQLKLANAEAELGLHQKEGVENLSILRQQLEVKNTALANAQRDITEERERTAILSRKVDNLAQLEDKHQLMEKEVNTCKTILEESSKCQLWLKEKALQMETDSKEKIREVCDALDVANSQLAEEQEKVASLLSRVESLDLIEGQRLLMQKELERYKERLEEASRCQIHLEEQALQRETESKEKLSKVCKALEAAKSELSKERERAVSLTKRVESLDLIEGQRFLMQKELERYKERLEEASRCQIHLEEQALQREAESKEKLSEVCNALEAAKSELSKERERAVSLTERVESLDHLEEQWLQKQDEVERYKKMLEEACRSRSQLEEQVGHMKKEFGEKLEAAFDALESVKSELAKERERTASLMKRVEQWALRQKDLDKYKERFEESFRCQLQLEEKISHIERDSERKLTEACNALEKANSELVEKVCKGHEIEFESWIWKSISERLKVDLEESRELRKQLEASLLAQVGVGQGIKKEKDDLIRITKEKDQEILSLQQHMVTLEQELQARELRAVSSAEDSILQITREHDKVLEDLRREIDFLEEESLRRELEGAAYAHIGAERSFVREKENILQLVKEKDERIDGLMQVVRSMEEDFNGSLNSFSSELTEKQEHIKLVHEAWEKIASAEILAKLEIEEKKLMIAELEDDIHYIQEKLFSQEKSLSDSKQLALTIEAELEAKHLEMKNLTDQMEERLRTSEASVDELRTEKANLLEDIMKLSTERDNLVGFIGGLNDSLGEFSSEDAQLMGILGRIVQSCDLSDSKGSNELYDCLKENKRSLPASPATKKTSSIFEERSPFRQLN
ncbi:hypothetical protein ERO13_D11G216300v2 [Gossypium hirsutum]|uniref:Uncharacterized protein At4g38062 n=1 Tax=Gossypium hirsutum TaxID=3635 RepID=A0A1U8K4J0_GOSHI|nr:uncharacterized protein At4g38062-like [Gossypium hirsutum]XP_016697447.2 uncharacterized protein At4g38062-like [Gossypium hirsutum]KAG4121573.1 hypothetical protein ERO13_D11G216300v2 [Gossypium hirsutum]KAG4121574.1 hypothetical protein ERO13_D11G216300v2 [Gossypium hirsutum]